MRARHGLADSRPHTASHRSTNVQSDCLANKCANGGSDALANCGAVSSADSQPNCGTDACTDARTNAAPMRGWLPRLRRHGWWHLLPTGRRQLHVRLRDGVLGEQRVAARLHACDTCTHAFAIRRAVACTHAFAIHRTDRPTDAQPHVTAISVANTGPNAESKRKPHAGADACANTDRRIMVLRHARQRRWRGNGNSWHRIR